jgi:hypothetical protein
MAGIQYRVGGQPDPLRLNGHTLPGSAFARCQNIRELSAGVDGGDSRSLQIIEPDEVGFDRDVFRDLLAPGKLQCVFDPEFAHAVWMLLDGGVERAVADGLAGGFEVVVRGEDVLVPYSERMKTLLKDAESFYSPKKRPSGHDISRSFDKDNGGAIPSNLLQYPNTESNSLYIRLCKMTGIEPHPARFPRSLPEFFIKFLTEKDDLVIDIFAGSNTTGEAAEVLGRRWLALESDWDYSTASAFRFMTDWPERAVRTYVENVQCKRDLPADVIPRQGRLL